MDAKIVASIEDIICCAESWAGSGKDNEDADWPAGYELAFDMIRAAPRVSDEADRLRADNERLRAALEGALGFHNSDVAHHWSQKGEQAAFHAMLNKARAALAKGAA